MNAVVEHVTEGKVLPSLGVHPGMPEAEYRAAPGANKSFLDDIAISPALAQWRRRFPNPPTKAMRLGSALHCLVLEPNEFDNRYVAQPVDAPKRPSAREVNAKKPRPEVLDAAAWWHAFDEAAAGREMLSTDSDDPIRDPSEWDRVHMMAAAVRRHPTASILFAPEEVITELPVFWIDDFCPEYRRLCKGKLDAWNKAHEVIVDLKKVPVEGAAESVFARKVHDYRYHVQDAFYRDGMRVASGDWPRAFIFVAVEDMPPYQIGVYTLPRDWVEQGRRQYIRDLTVLSKCMDTGEWPSYPADIREMGMPGFAKFVPVA